MGEIIDLEFYRRQRKRRLVDTNVAEPDAAKMTGAANRRDRRRNRTERDRLRPAIAPPAVEVLDRAREGVDPAAEAEPGDKSAD